MFQNHPTPPTTRVRMRNNVEPSRALKRELKNEYNMLSIACLFPFPVVFSDAPSRIVEDSSCNDALAILNQPRCSHKCNNLKTSKPAANAVDKLKTSSGNAPKSQNLQIWLKMQKTQTFKTATSRAQSRQIRRHPGNVAPK